MSDREIPQWSHCGEKELGVGLITSGEDVRMGKLLSQSGLLFPFHQVASKHPVGPEDQGEVCRGEEEVVLSQE